MIKIAFDPIYAHPLPENHRFPMLKYQLIPEQLMYEGTYTAENFFAPTICKEEIILYTHDQAYLNKLLHQQLSASEQRKIGFPQSPELTKRELIITQGTIDACLNAMECGVALNVAGGTHHAFADRGEGFCLLNDMAIAANYLLRKQFAKKILIIDLDIGLKDGTTGQEYLAILEETVPKLINQVKPDFAFYLSGVDILETDKFGKLKVSLNECKQRDQIVFDQLKQHQIPVTVALGGGYSPDVKTIVEAHCNTFRIAADLYS